MVSQTLICINYPHQVIPAISAVIHYRKQNNIDLHDSAILLVWVHLSKKDKRRGIFISSLKAITNVFLWLRIELITEKNHGNVCNTNISIMKRASIFKKNMANSQVSSVFYAHDVSGDFFPQIVMQSFQKAHRVCYGDALGIVYTNKYFEKQTYRKWHSLSCLFNVPVLVRDVFTLIKRKVVLPNTVNILESNTAILILPSDPSCGFLKGKELFIPTKGEVLDVIKRINLNLTDLNTYMNKLSSQLNNSSYMLLLNNFYASGLSDRNNEIQLYLNIIENNIPKGKDIILKLHPGSSERMITQLVSSIQQEYQVHVIPDKYAFLPIELYDTFIKKYHILSLSYSSVSISYLYDKEVQHVLNSSLIEKYLKKNKRTWIRESNNYYLSMITAIKNNVVSEGRCLEGVKYGTE